MRVGVVVDGEAEYRTIATLVAKLPGAPVIIPLLADIQPYSSPKSIAAAVRRKVNSLRNCAKIVVLIDLEQNDYCPGVWAREIEEEIERQCDVSCPVYVVVKVRMYENWLLGDPNGINQRSSIFRFSAKDIRAIEPDKADHILDPVRMLTDAKRKTGTKKGQEYKKVEDAYHLVQRVDPLVVAENSRSFRKFLGVLGVEPYRNQTKRPASRIVV